MGSIMKPTIFNERVAEALRNWHQTAKKHISQNRVGPSLSSRPTIPSHHLSPVHLLRYYCSEMDNFPPLHGVQTLTATTPSPPTSILLPCWILLTWQDRFCWEIFRQGLHLLIFWGKIQWCKSVFQWETWWCFQWETWWYDNLKYAKADDKNKFDKMVNEDIKEELTTKGLDKFNVICLHF